MKKILTFCAAVLASVSMWAATETVPKFSDNWTGTSISFTNSEGANGSSDQKKDGDAEKVTYVKFRTNKNGNTITLNVTDGYKVTGLYLRGYTNDGSTSVSLNSVKYDDADAITTNLEFPLSGAGTTATYENNTDVARNAIVLQMSNSGKQLMAVLRVTYSLACTDPELTVLPTEGTGFVGDPIDITVSSKNQSKPLNSAVTVDGVPGEAGKDYTFSASTGLVQATPLKAGKFEITFSQASNGTYCAAEETVTFVISEKTPVASVTVDGPTAAYVGEAVTFTATAANASDYAWTVNGVDANTNAAEFTYTPAAAGEYSIVCSARNKFNAAEEWIASEAKVLTASNVSGVLVSYTVNSDANGAANLTGALAAKATAKVSLTKGSSQALDTYTGYKMDKGKYVGVTLTSGKFAEGDTVSFMVTKASGTAKLYLYDNEQGTNRLDSIEFSGKTGWATFVLNQATAGVYLYRSNPDVKPYDQNPHVAAMKVVRPKAVKSTSEEFKGATINGDALNVSDFKELEGNQRVNVLETSYVEAPVVVFTKTVTTTYEDDSKTTKDVEVEVTAFNPAGTERWQARTTINGVDYVVSCSKTASVVVTYMDGETVLGTENVAANGNPANYEQYQSKSLASFVGWYNNADLADEHAVADMSAEVISKATTYYAKFENKYAESINMEQLVLDNGTAYDLMSFMGGKGFASNITNSLDTLNDLEKKDNRNYAFLGLKVKAEGKLLDFRLAANSTVKVKFGNVGATPLVSINGGEYAAMELAEGVYTYTATAEALISIKTASSATLIFKQIMIDADLAEVVLPAPGAYAITLTPGENGQLTASWEGKTDKKVNVPVGATVTLTVTPAEGYKIAAVTVNGETVEAVEGAYSFIMPAAAAAVSATFVEDTASALGNTEAEAKAVKVVRDGQLLILKNGVLYNAQGAIVK